MEKNVLANLSALGSEVKRYYYTAIPQGWTKSSNNIMLWLSNINVSL